MSTKSSTNFTPEANIWLNVTCSKSQQLTGEAFVSQNKAATPASIQNQFLKLQTPNESPFPAYTKFIRLHQVQRFRAKDFVYKWINVKT